MKKSFISKTSIDVYIYNISSVYSQFSDGVTRHVCLFCGLVPYRKLEHLVFLGSSPMEQHNVLGTGVNL